MLYTYAECKKIYKTDYELRKVLAAGTLKKIRRGVYSDRTHESDLAIISKLYPRAVFTMDSAFYYHGLTDTVPRKYHLITDKDAAKIRNKEVVQYYDNNSSLKLGKEMIQYNGTEIAIFNRERMLVELIRNKAKLPFDYYKEIIYNYRKVIYDMDIQSIQEYAAILPKSKLVMNTLQLEVF